MNKKIQDLITAYIIKINSIISIFICGAILIFLLLNGLMLFKYVSPIDFIFGSIWNINKGYYGILPMIIGTILLTILTLIMAVPISLSCAIYLSELAPFKLKYVFEIILETLTVIPSVIYGFVGSVLLVPILRNDFNINPGYSLFAASVVLTIMILPTITLLSKDTFQSVPVELKEGSLSLGSTKWQMIKGIILPHSINGILSSILLGLSRAIGETMAVVMVSGNWAIIPKSIFDPIRTLPSHIILNIKECAYNSIVYYAMFATSLFIVLFIVVLVIIVEYLKNKEECK